MYKNSISNFKKIKNINIQNFLEENGIYPVEEWDEDAYYERTTKLSMLLDLYFIKFICVPNR